MTDNAATAPTAGDLLADLSYALVAAAVVQDYDIAEYDARQRAVDVGDRTDAATWLAGYVVAGLEDRPELLLALRDELIAEYGAATQND